MITISKRLCVLANKAKADGKEGDNGEDFTQLTFELEAISLSANELNMILSEPHAHQVLFNTGKEPIEPYLKSLKAIELKEPMVGAYVCIELGLEGHAKFEFTDCKISKIKLAPALGGDTLMSCKVVVKPALNETLAELLDRLGHTISVEIRGEAPGAQQDLPLNTFTDGGEQATMSNTGRQIQAAAGKAERKRRRQEAADKFN
jgi:hypothetical protein